MGEIDGKYQRKSENVVEVGVRGSGEKEWGIIKEVVINVEGNYLL